MSSLPEYLIEFKSKVESRLATVIEAIAEELGTSLKQIRRYVASGQLVKW